MASKEEREASIYKKTNELQAEICLKFTCKKKSDVSFDSLGVGSLAASLVMDPNGRNAD